MGFDPESECIMCYFVGGGGLHPKNRLICTYCLERHEQHLPNGLLFGLKDAFSEELCAVCSKKRKLLFRLLVCDEHCGHYAEEPLESKSTEPDSDSDEPLEEESNEDFSLPELSE